MKAAVMYGAGNLRVVERPDARLHSPSDAVVGVLAAAVCGSDLRHFETLPHTEQGRPMGHEFLGVVEDVGPDVPGLKRGDLVVSPFTFCDNTCGYCRRGLHTSCPQGGLYGLNGTDGGQGEAVCVPQAHGTLVKLPVSADSALLPALLTLADVLPTGHHGAVTAGVRPGDRVAVIGDGAVGLCAVLAARRLGAEQIVLMGRHPDRTRVGRAFGATDVVAARGQEAIAQARDLTGGAGTGRVIEAVGTREALDTAFGVVSDGGSISRLGVPRYEQGPIGLSMMTRNITLTGGAAPARAYIPQLLADIVDGTLSPGAVFDRTAPLHQTPDAYGAMATRQALKVLIRV